MNSKSKYIEYELDEGQIIKIPRDEVERLMDLPDVKTIDDACWIWCEDNDYVINPEQAELDRQAKESRITATIHQARADNKKPRKKVERKPDETKESLISGLAEYLAELVDNVKVVNIGKLIEFEFKGEQYKLDLIRKRTPKK